VRGKREFIQVLRLMEVFPEAAKQLVLIGDIEECDQPVILARLPNWFPVARIIVESYRLRARARA
jgi:hypothetical protein